MTIDYDGKSIDQAKVLKVEGREGGRERKVREKQKRERGASCEF